MDDRTQPMLKTKFRDVIFPDFPDDDNTVTTTVTKSRRVSFGTNLVKEFIVGSAVSAQCVSEYEQAFSSSDSSNANSSYSAVESGILDQNTFVVEEKSKILQPIPPPNGSNILDGESLDRTLSKRPKFGSTICFSADSPTADMEFTEGCLTLAKSILDKKNKEMTVIIQAKPKEEEKAKDEETKYFDGSQFDMSMTKCFKSKENTKKEEKRFEEEKTRIFSSQDDDMSMTKCDKLFRMRVESGCDYDDSDENMEDDSKENQIPLDLIMRHLDKDKDNTDFEKFLFHPQKSLSDVLNANSLDLSNDSEKLNLNESMDISRDFQPELLAAKCQPSIEEKTVAREEKSSLSVTKTIEEQVYVSREEIILREERLVLIQKEGESLSGIRTAYESLEEEKEETEDAEMEITLTGSGNVVPNEKGERSNDVEVTKDTNEEVSKALKDTIEDEFIDKSLNNEKIDENISNQESKEMDVETETKEMSLEVAKEQKDMSVSKEEEEEESLKLGIDDEKVVTNSPELSFSKQQEESGTDVSKEQISGNVDVTMTEEKETKESLNLSEGLMDKIEASSMEPEEQKDSTGSVMTSEEKLVVETTEEEDEKEEQNSDMEMTLAKEKKPKEMTLDEVLKEITKDHETFDEKVLEKYFEMDPEGEPESFLEKDMEDVEMQLDLDELNDDSVNKSEVSSKDSPKGSVAPRRESIRVEKRKAKPEVRKEESEKVVREPPLADAKVIEGIKQQSKERHCVWEVTELGYEEKGNVWFVSFNLKLLDSSTTIKFRLKESEEEDGGLYAWSAISSAEMELNPDENPTTKDYKTAVMFGYEIQSRYFREEKKMATTTQHIPYFLDKMNSFSLKLNGYLTQIHLILSSFPGSRLKGSVLSFRLYSFPLLFSSTVSFDLTDLFRLSKSCLSFDTEFGSLDENKMKGIFEKYLNEEGPALLPSIINMTRQIITNEIEETGRVSKRDHIPLLNGSY